MKRIHFIRLPKKNFPKWEPYPWLRSGNKFLLNKIERDDWYNQLQTTFVF